MKAVKVPDVLTTAPYYLRELRMNGVSLVESCTHSNHVGGCMYLEEHMLMVVLEGTNRIVQGNNIFMLHKNEMVFLKKATQVTFDKRGNPDNNMLYDSMLFFIKEEFLVDFMKLAKIESVNCAEPVKVEVKPVGER